MRRFAKTGPTLSFSPEGIIKFKGAHREQGIEVLNATIDISNDSTRTVHFRFDNDSEFKFTPHRGCIPPHSTTTVKATFYNVDGHCCPRRSSVGLRAIRVHNEDPMDVDVTWKRTPATLVTHKRWKFTFEKGRLPTFSPRDTTSPSSDVQAMASEYGDVGDAKTGTPTWMARAVDSCVHRWFELGLVFAGVTILAAFTAYRYKLGAKKNERDPADCVTIWNETYCF